MARNALYGVVLEGTCDGHVGTPDALMEAESHLMKDSGAGLSAIFAGHVTWAPGGP